MVSPVSVAFIGTIGIVSAFMYLCQIDYGSRKMFSEPQVRVEIIPQEIAEDVENEHRHHDGEAGEDDHPG